MYTYQSESYKDYCSGVFKTDESAQFYNLKKALVN